MVCVYKCVSKELYVCLPVCCLSSRQGAGGKRKPIWGFHFSTLSCLGIPCMSATEATEAITNYPSQQLNNVRLAAEPIFWYQRRFDFYPFNLPTFPNILHSPSLSLQKSPSAVWDAGKCQLFRSAHFSRPSEARVHNLHCLFITCTVNNHRFTNQPCNMSG